MAFSLWILLLLSVPASNAYSQEKFEKVRGHFYESYKSINNTIAYSEYPLVQGQRYVEALIDGFSAKEKLNLYDKRCELEYCRFDESNGCSEKCAKYAKLHDGTKIKDAEKYRIPVDENDCKTRCSEHCHQECKINCADLCEIRFAYADRKNYEEERADFLKKIDELATKWFIKSGLTVSL